MLWLFWVLGRGAGSFDGIDRDERHCEQLAGTSDILGAGLAGEQAVVADAMKALWKYMHQEAADELGGIERHHLVSLGAFEFIRRFLMHVLPQGFHRIRYRSEEHTS